MPSVMIAMMTEPGLSSSPSAAISAAVSVMSLPIQFQGRHVGDRQSVIDDLVFAVELGEGHTSFTVAGALLGVEASMGPEPFSRQAVRGLARQ